MEEISIGPSVDKIGKKSILDAQKQDQVVGRLHTIVFKELHQEMGHLGAPRVVQLAPVRFYCLLSLPMS